MTESELRYKIHLAIPKPVIKSGHKAEFVSGIIGRAIESTTECTGEELCKIFYRLKYAEQFTYAHYAMFESSNKQHMAMLNACYDAGEKYTTYNEKLRREVPNMEALGRWIQSKKSPVKKPLALMSKTELTRMIVAFRNVSKFSRRNERYEY